MRGKVTDQDLTDYALNALSADERLYVESMLAVSEECRHDVYQMLEVSEMLREGFEEQEEGASLLLDEAQREKVLSVPRWQWRGFIQRAAAVALLAAGTAYAVKNRDLWQASGAADKIASAGQSFGGFVATVGNNGFPKTAEEFTARILGATKPVHGPDFQFVSAPAVCTPPLYDTPKVSDVVEM